MANLINFNDNQNYTNANTVEEDPVEALQAQLNSLSMENRENVIDLTNEDSSSDDEEL